MTLPVSAEGDCFGEGFGLDPIYRLGLGCLFSFSHFGGVGSNPLLLLVLSGLAGVGSNPVPRRLVAGSVGCRCTAADVAFGMVASAAEATRTAAGGG